MRCFAHKMHAHLSSTASTGFEKMALSDGIPLTLPCNLQQYQDAPDKLSLVSRHPYRYELIFAQDQAVNSPALLLPKACFQARERHLPPARCVLNLCLPRVQGVRCNAGDHLEKHHAGEMQLLLEGDTAQQTAATQLLRQHF